MATTAEYLISIASSKEAIRQAIEAKRQTCGTDVPFDQYAGKILDITTGDKDFYQCVYVGSDGTWKGYKAVLENGKYHFQSFVTDGLRYTSVTPEVGKIYTGDALAIISYLYDITGSAGQCPNLAACVSVTCPDCNEKYCKTHDTHTCESGGVTGGGDKECPDLESCKVATCPDCKEEYCKTHEEHTCDGSGEGGDDSGDGGGGDNPNVDPNCPFGENCNLISCKECGTSYCSTHETHENCTGKPENPDNPDNPVCPDTPECSKLTCAFCGTEYCSTHTSHDNCTGQPPEGCPDLPECSSGNCTNCGTSYCLAHEHRICSSCNKELCTSCVKIKDGEHVCETCANSGGGCYLCGGSGAGNCEKCGKIYCVDHQSPTGEYICTKCANSSSSEKCSCCDGDIEIVPITCDLCGKGHCTDCISEVTDSDYLVCNKCKEGMTECGMCGENTIAKCALCDNTVCLRHNQSGMSKCEDCDNLVCGSCLQQCNSCKSYFCANCIKTAVDGFKYCEDCCEERYPTCNAVVSGCSDQEANGTYTLTDEAYCGRQIWRKGGYQITYHSGNYWYISTPNYQMAASGGSSYNPFQCEWAEGVTVTKG